MRSGLQLAKGRYMAVLSADLQDPPSLVLEMVNRWKKGNKFVVCARKTRKDPFIKKFLARIIYLLISFDCIEKLIGKIVFFLTLFFLYFLSIEINSGNFFFNHFDF